MGLWAPSQEATVMNILFPPTLCVMHSIGWLNDRKKRVVMQNVE